MFGSQNYQEGHFAPKRGGNMNWHVWCATGALQVLDTAEYVEWLNNNPNDAYTINFANGSTARIHPDHRLWHVLVKIAETYRVEVYPLNWNNTYVPWTGGPDSLRHFDALVIMSQVSTEAGDHH